jgi:hypothetical protein
MFSESTCSVVSKNSNHLLVHRIWAKHSLSMICLQSELELTTIIINQSMKFRLALPLISEFFLYYFCRGRISNIIILPHNKSTFPKYILVKALLQSTMKCTSYKTLFSVPNFFLAATGCPTSYVMSNATKMTRHPGVRLPKIILFKPNH